MTDYCSLIFFSTTSTADETKRMPKEMSNMQIEIKHDSSNDLSSESISCGNLIQLQQQKRSVVDDKPFN